MRFNGARNTDELRAQFRREKLTDLVDSAGAEEEWAGKKYYTREVKSKCVGRPYLKQREQNHFERMYSSLDRSLQNNFAKYEVRKASENHGSNLSSPQNSIME